MDTLRKWIMLLVDSLKIKLSAEEMALVFGSNSNPNELERFGKQIGLQFDEMCIKYDEVRKKLDQLWASLEIDPAIRQSFDQMLIYHIETYDALVQEYKRCEKIKDGKEIVKVYEEHKKLAEKKHELEKRSNDPNKFINRKAQMYLDQQETKKISNRIPKIQKQFSYLCGAYKNSYNEDFKIDGKTIEEILNEIAEEQNTARPKPSTSSTRMSGQRMERKSQVADSKKNITRNGLPLPKSSAFKAAKPPLMSKELKRVIDLLLFFFNYLLLKLIFF